MLYMFWCQVAIVTAASLSLHLKHALKYPSWSVCGLLLLVCERVWLMPILLLYKSKCTMQFMLLAQHGYDMSCTPTCPLEQQRVWSLTPSLNNFTSHLHCLDGYVWVCHFESNVLYVWAQTGLFALSGLCLHRRHTQHSPDVTLCRLLPVFSHVYDTLCKHWTILWLRNQLVHSGSL